ncbi:hypothetical protein Pcinc_015651 [Petrolisthes cinctipes]|uniref:Uncharacterized protein n=1 Tax=Petrolisthes cinctipes TaxID=88211 RepID=A0AAE1FSW7_PETCI|nr:hypothetical protein Pcinc_015651 [Petrolisthes cinctipes]
MWTPSIQQHIPGSNIEPMLCLRKDTISPSLALNKLISICSAKITSPPTIGTLLKIKCGPTLISKPRMRRMRYGGLIERVKQSYYQTPCETEVPRTGPQALTLNQVQ